MNTTAVLTILTIGDAIQIHEARANGMKGVGVRLRKLDSHDSLEFRAVWELRSCHGTDMWDLGVDWMTAQNKFCDLVPVEPKFRKSSPLLAEARRGLMMLDDRYIHLTPQTLAQKMDLAYIGLVQLHVDHPAKMLVAENHEELWLMPAEKRDAKAA